MPRKFKLGRHRKNEERLKSAKKQKIEEALDSCATINIKSLKHRLEAVSGGLPQGSYFYGYSCMHVSVLYTYRVECHAKR